MGLPDPSPQRDSEGSRAALASGESPFSHRVDDQLLRGYRNACFGLGGFYLLLTGWRLALGPSHGLTRALVWESAVAAVLFLSAGSFWWWLGPGSLSENLFMAISGGLFGTLVWRFIQALLGSLARLRAKDRTLLRQRARLVGELESALERVKTLHGLIPICAHCKRVRDDQGYWEQVETYIRDRSDATFSHGICPHCLGELQSELEDLHPERGV